MQNSSQNEENEGNDDNINLINEQTDLKRISGIEMII